LSEENASIVKIKYAAKRYVTRTVYANRAKNHQPVCAPTLKPAPVSLAINNWLAVPVPRGAALPQCLKRTVSKKRQLQGHLSTGYVNCSGN
jgi:hypothetical protein